MKNPTSNRTARTTTTSHEQTEHTKLGPSFDVVGVSTIADQDYPNDQEMEDTASNLVQVIGEVVLETDVFSLGLTPTVPLSAEYLHEVTGPSTAVTRNPNDVGSVSTEKVISGVNVTETIASGSQAPRCGSLRSILVLYGHQYFSTVLSTL